MPIMTAVPVASTPLVTMTYATLPTFEISYARQRAVANPTCRHPSSQAVLVSNFGTAQKSVSCVFRFQKLVHGRETAAVDVYKRKTTIADALSSLLTPLVTLSLIILISSTALNINQSPQDALLQPHLSCDPRYRRFCSGGHRTYQLFRMDLYRCSSH